MSEENGLSPCWVTKGWINPNATGSIGRKTAPLLFSGIFFGDYKKLVELQKKCLEKTDNKEWNEIRSVLYNNEIINRIKRIKERLGFSAGELNEVRQLIALRRVPPPLEEARKVIYRRWRAYNLARS